MKIWKTLSTKMLFENPWWSAHVDEFEIPGVTKGTYTYAISNGSAVIIPIDADGKIVCVKQYRYLAERFSLEFPGGGIKKEQVPEEAAHAELAEEAGFHAERMIHVGTVAPILGFLKESEYVYVATDLQPAVAHKDDTEEFEIVRLTVDEIESAIQSGEIFNGWALGAWAVARPHVLRLVDEIHRNQ